MEKPRPDPAEGDEDRPGSPAEPETETVVHPAVDVLVTGGVDDLVKVWHYDDGELKLRHKLGDHSLGVVSVALSKDAEREQRCHRCYPTFNAEINVDKLYFLRSSSL